MSARSNASTSSNATIKIGAKPSKPKNKIRITEETITRRSEELRNITDFLLGDLFGGVLGGRVFMGNLADAVFSAPSGAGIKLKLRNDLER
jgi:hypothetical protein